MENAKLLIVDDNAEILALLTEHFAKKWQVITAENGKIGLEKIYSENPNVVLTDIRMPVMDGFEMVSLLRSTGDNRVVIFFTSKRDAKSVAQAIKLRCFDFVQKPINLHDMDLTVTEGLMFALDDSSTSIKVPSPRPKGGDGPSTQKSRRELVHDVLNAATVALFAARKLQSILKNPNLSEEDRICLNKKTETTISAVVRMIDSIELL